MKISASMIKLLGFISKGYHHIRGMKFHSTELLKHGVKWSSQEGATSTIETWFLEMFDDEDSIKGNNRNNHVDEDDDLFNDGSECNDFLHQGSGLIKDTCEDNVNGDFLKSSELVVEGILGAEDNDANSTKNPNMSDISKNTPTCDSQTTPTYQNEGLLDSLMAKVQMLESKAENKGLNNEEIAEHLSCLKSIQELEHKENMDFLQKGKIKWAIEGDKNFKFFHGMLNNKFSRSRINGLFTNGNWISDPHLVTSHIFNFHRTKFQKSSIIRPTFTSIRFKSLSMSESSSLDAPFTTLEIKDAVWSYGGEKASGPDGFTYKFIKHYWDTISNDFIEMVKRFEVDGNIPRGCNSSFITLVPKTNGPLHIKDHRPTSLIGCLYNVIAKLLANRLVKVVSSVVSEVQMTFIKGRQIIDGPLMVNEILSWAGKNKERLFMIKVDFEKAFNTLD
ncbi:putative RNA-directed DNA polymerase, eukaryota, reverse transcriptase zinc-binding domain protein [Tanacetum coccineum]